MTLSSLHIVKRDRYNEEKRNYVYAIMSYLDENTKCKTRKDRIVVTRKIFDCTHKLKIRKKFFKNHYKYKVAIQQKLIEFYKYKSWREAKVWYEKIFEEPIPN
jgi:hypothetical protein